MTHLATPEETLVLVPARMASTRLPGKPLADIAGLPMIVQVVNRAREAAIGRVVVATDDERVKAEVERHGAEAVMTDVAHQSGSDRIWEAVTLLDPDGHCSFIVNVQGDLPTIDPALIADCLKTLAESSADIATLAARITVAEERTNPNVVKAVGTGIGENRMRALYFTRATAPWGEGDLYHHIGLYAYRREALQRFVALKPSPLEVREKLEQLRALEAGMRIDIAIVDTVPLGVDTPHDLDRARAMLA
ncbi:MAG: 3-deoxy-manno-octulosonate cytidylyltransferase [Nitratireductor sp.]|nr:3-deoxy-manno-octulosonate cytidylyltransferase [Nitratireductor sp.]MCB1459575.1 3-deoxy-manno-octulosonate cytidylyltransferase [Nitratireductor sp.]